MLQRREEFLLLDCRRPDETDVQVIQGCTIVPMQNLALYMEELRAWESKPIVVYCRSGSRSLRVTSLLRQMGFENVKSMAGGINRWSADIDPQIKPY